jgi:voltage-gated potassium channel
MKKRAWLDGLIGLLAILSIIIIVVESVITLSTRWLFVLYSIDLFICLIFAAEFIYRLQLTNDKSSFLKTHGFEILAMVPAVALYAAGTLPVISAGLRSLRLIRVVRVVFVVVRMRRFFNITGRFVQRSGLVYLMLITFSIIFLGGFAALALEYGTENPQITSFPDAIWWSISTVTTVGYGDIVPNSIAGRIMGMFLMVIGIGIMTAFISGVSATIVEGRLKQEPDREGLRGTLAA